MGLPELTLHGLADADAQALLAAAISGRIDAGVRDRVVAESRGNPLALLELPWGMTAAELTGGFGVPNSTDLSGQIEEHFLRRLVGLPEGSRRLLLVAAADPTGEVALLWRAAETLGIGRDAALAPDAEQLVEIGRLVRFRHPLVRSAAYSGAPLADRREVHLALAAAMDPDADPDRRAWHLALAAAEPDEEVASELERSADRRRSRGGMAAAAAFLDRSVALTPDPRRRAERALAAAQTHLQAGEFDAARQSLVLTELGPLDELNRARVELLRGLVAFASGGGSGAPALLLKAAQQIEPLDVGLARHTYLDAWSAAFFAGGFVSTPNLCEVARAACGAPPPVGPPRPSDRLLDGLAIAVTEGRAAAAPILRQVAHQFAEEEIAQEEGLRWAWLASLAAITLWDDEASHALLARQLNAAREAGLLVHLPIYVNGLGLVAVWRGDFTTADSLIAEADAIAQATGAGFARYTALLAAGLRETEAAARQMIEPEMRDARAAGQGIGTYWCQLASAILFNAHGHYDEALEQAQHASEQPSELYITAFALPELIEAAVRTGGDRLAADALARLTEATAAAASDWALGVGARSRALVNHDQGAEDSYREAVDRLGLTRIRPDLARAHLVYGEWLRRQNRRSDGRDQLRRAYDMFSEMGMLGFAERALHELRATGETVRKRQDETRNDLTPQEEHIARLALEGLTNPEIGGQLYISARTVEWHLRKVFMKLNITSRRELRNALPAQARPRRQN